MTPTSVPPSGGGSSPPPTSSTAASEIVRNLFEGDKERKLSDQQRSSAIQDQGRQRQDLRDASGTDRSAHEAGRGEEAKQGNQPEVRTRPETRRVEREIDSFLSRASNQQAQREAGREMSRPQTLSSINAQAWTVAGSPHTPETARSLLQQRQPQNTTTAHPNPSANPSLAHSGAGTATNRSLPIFTRPAAPTLSPAPLVIRYASTSTRSSEGSERPFTGRPMVLENFRGQIQRLVQEQLGRTAQQTLGNQPNVAVDVRGNVVFIRDGEKFRAFRLDKEGNLTELPSDDAGEHALSPEAQKLLEKVLRQKGLHAKLSGDGADHAGELSEHQLTELIEKNAAEEKAGENQELDFETRFALLLHEVLEEGKALKKKLDGDPDFPGKGDWTAFFAKLAKLGNQEKSSSKTMDSVLNMIFRGLFKKQGKGNVLVGDLKYMKGGKTREEKFAQVSLSDSQLMDLFKGLKPGQKISRESLGSIFGEELAYLIMAHAEEKSFNMASHAEKNVVFNPKSQVDLYGQARMEKTIFASRKDKRDVQKNGAESSGAPLTVPTNPNELMGLPDKAQGRPRFYTFLLYGIFATLTAILLFFLLMKLMD